MVMVPKAGQMELNMRVSDGTIRLVGRVSLLMLMEIYMRGNERMIRHMGRVCIYK